MMITDQSIRAIRSLVWFCQAMEEGVSIDDLRHVFEIEEVCDETMDIQLSMALTALRLNNKENKPEAIDPML